MTNKEAIAVFKGFKFLPREQKAVDLAIKALEQSEERYQGEWIPVSERWPAFSGLYLVSIDDLVTVANFTGAYFINKKDLMLNVSAWQELPEPYKKGSGN